MHQERLGQHLKNNLSALWVTEIRAALIGIHSVGARALSVSRGILGFQLIANIDIQIPFVLVIWFVREITAYGFSFLNSDYFSQVKHCLLPMGVFRVWTGRKSDGLVTGRELNVKPCDESMNEIIPSASKTEWCSERELCGGDGVKVDCEDRAWICDQSFHFDGVDQGLCKGAFLHG